MEKRTCLTSDSVIKGYKESSIAKSEKNDCVVRAIAASFNIPYDKAHKFTKEEFRRKDKSGTFGTVYTMNRLSKKDGKIFNKKVEMIGEKDEYYNFPKLYNGKSKMTLLSFLKQYQKGTYFILVRGHALTVKNGVLIGNDNEGLHLRRIVEYAFKIGVR